MIYTRGPLWFWKLRWRLNNGYFLLKNRWLKNMGRPYSKGGISGITKERKVKLDVGDGKFINVKVYSVMFQPFTISSLPTISKDDLMLLRINPIDPE